MPFIDVKKQSPIEFNGSFKDELDALIRRTFEKTDVLVFVTYQPIDLTLDHKQVVEHTAGLFSKVKYVEVIEQTFKTSKRYNDSGYLNGFHSHLILRESDYNRLKEGLKGLDVKPKIIYDLDGLKRYLSKQAGVVKERMLPKSHSPQITIESIDIPIATQTQKQEGHHGADITLSYQIVAQFLNRINKISAIHMFIDDT